MVTADAPVAMNNRSYFASHELVAFQNDDLHQNGTAMVLQQTASPHCETTSTVEWCGPCCCCEGTSWCGNPGRVTVCP